MKKSIFKFISLLCSCIIPKEIIIFNSFPDYTDNPYAFYLAVKKDHFFDSYKLIWLVSEKCNYLKLRKEIEKDNRTKCYLKLSLKGFYYLLFCKYFVCSHGVFPELKFKRKNRMLINLWHGMPLKAIGTFDKKNNKRSIFNNTQLGVATNNFFGNLLAKSFGIDKNKILPIGQPRNDLLFSPTDFYEIYNINKSIYKKVGAWLPTYKKNIYTEKRIDGTYKPGNIGPLALEDLHLLDKELRCNNILLVIKIHPMDANNLIDFGVFSNICIIKSNSPKFQLYPFLGSVDFLLTDFSSVFVDFDILKKPMGFVLEDIDSYSANRGFIVGDLKKFLPGNFLYNFDDILSFIVNSDERYIETGHKYNDYKDNCASERLLKMLRKN